MLLSFMDNLICFMGVGMVEAMLEPHMLAKADSTILEVGETFMIYNLVYVFASVFAGYVS